MPLRRKQLLISNSPNRFSEKSEILKKILKTSNRNYKSGHNADESVSKTRWLFSRQIGESIHLSGPDLLSPRLLKEGDTALAEPLSILFNRSLEKCQVPVTWKDANVSPIYKKDEKSLPSNYRPISLLSSIGKAMERCVHKHLNNYVINNDLITPLQSGFKHGDSTNLQLIHTYHSFCEAVDSGKEIRAVPCDVSKAFDRVWHRELLYK